MTSTSRKWTHPSVIKFLDENGSSDPILLIKEIAREVVSNAFDKGWIGPPFSPVKLAELREIDILPHDSTFEARTIPIGKNKYRIEYNPTVKPTRINFSIAHEIAHTFFSDCAETIRYRKKEPSSWELEFLCDIAASEILLPYAVFAHDARASRPTIPGLLSLAERYDASFEALLLRYAEVVQEPCAIIISIFETNTFERLRVLYSRPSSGFDISIPNGFLIPRNSKAYECVSAGWSSQAVEEWPIFGRNKYIIHSIGLSPLKDDTRLRVGSLIFQGDDAGEIRKNAINYILGDATVPRGAGTKIIGQIVNSGAALGAGFGRAMAKNWPASGQALRHWKENHTTFRLGESKLTELSDDVYVFQMLAQKGVTSTEKSIGLKYSALRKCLAQLAAAAENLHASVHMPRIGIGQAGGDWPVIEGMIIEELLNKGTEVTIYDLPGSRPKKRQDIPSLFEISG